MNAHRACASRSVRGPPMRPAPGCFPSSLALRVLSEDPRFLTASAASRKPAASRSACFLAAKSLQSCLTLCDPRDGSPPGSPVPGSLQAGTLEWVAMSFSNAGKGSRSVVSDPQRPHGLQPTRLLRPWDFPGKSPGVGGHSLFISKMVTRCLQTLAHVC